MPGEGHVYKLRPGAALWREIGSQTIVLDLEASRYLGVNPTGTVLWEALVEGATRDQLLAQLRRSFDVDEERANDDVAAFLRECSRRGWLEE